MRARVGLTGLVAAARVSATVWALVSATVWAPAGRTASAQDGLVWKGDPVPDDVEVMYARGLAYLVKAQEQGTSVGEYGSGRGGDAAGIHALVVLATLAHGDDPNVGPYSEAVRRGLDAILKSAQAENGYIGSSMYHHGFATLALAEAYGAVNDPRIGPALEKAVKLILSSQAQNVRGAWRYSPESKDADTTVSGAQMVALLAARNAGIAVPEKAIERGLQFYRSTQGGDGGFGYTGADASSPARSAIGALVFALARKKNTPEFKAAAKNLTLSAGQADYDGYYHYTLYYAAQAYFHSDMKGWGVWTEANRKRLAATQGADGSWPGANGPVFCTAASLLSLALEYRFLPIYER